MTEGLEGAAVVVTGAGKGIGREIALAFGRAGALVGLTGRDRAGLDETLALVRESGGDGAIALADIRVPDEVEAMAARLLGELGRVDVLVCNSGVAGPTAPLWEIALEEWEDTLRINVTGTFLCCKALLPAMIERHSGSVVVIGSLTGKRPLHGRTPYTTSKLGLVGLVRTLAWETGPYGIRVNLISPGFVAGPRIERVIAAQAKTLSITPDEVRERMVSPAPLARLTPAQDVAACAVFLASPAAASITGEDMNVSGGVVMY
jgi:NAD(P)-dependent dehydrogenase (short-subunit alcohol dehydrogenase family)